KVKGSNLYIFGAGEHTKALFEQGCFEGFNICGILDKNEGKKGTLFASFPVYHTSSMRELPIDYILVSSASFEQEIYEELIPFYSTEKLITIYHNIHE